MCRIFICVRTGVCYAVSKLVAFRVCSAAYFLFEVFSLYSSMSTTAATTLGWLSGRRFWTLNSLKISLRMCSRNADAFSCWNQCWLRKAGYGVSPERHGQQGSEPNYRGNHIAKSNTVQYARQAILPDPCHVQGLGCPFMVGRH